MKPHTLPIKRKPVTKGILHKLSAVTSSRKQRVAATADPDDMDADEGSSKIARALTIIFLIHIVAVGLIFVHQHFLKKRTQDTAATPEAIETIMRSNIRAVAAVAPAIAATPAPESPGRLASGEKVYVVKPGDSYATIASREGVAEQDLRAVNENVEIRTGLILSVPAPTLATQAVAEAESQPSAHTEPLVHEDDGLVRAVDVSGAPRATAISTANTTAAAPATTSGRTHTVKSGDNIWRISQQYKVKQDDLMKANKITDARKVRIGMRLIIPE